MADALSTSTWYHCVARLNDDASYSDIIVNGKIIKTDVSMISPSVADRQSCWIGRPNNYAEAYFDGKMEQIIFPE